MNSKDTAILEYAKYVENCHNTLDNILEMKNIKVDKNNTVMDSVLQANALNNYETSIVYSYEPDPYFLQMEEDWNNDPLLIKNGGIYYGSTYQILLAKHHSTYVDKRVFTGNNGINILIKTSDGQEFHLTSGALDSFNITWDTTKDITLQDGRRIRWIKIYVEKNLGFYGIRGEFDETSIDEPSIICLMYNTAISLPGTGSTRAPNNINDTYIEYMVLGDKVTSSSAYNNQNIRYLKTHNEIPFTSGFFHSNVKRALERYDGVIVSLALFEHINSIREADLSNVSISTSINTLNAPCCKKIKFPDIITIRYGVNAESIEVLELPQIITVSSFSLNCPNLKILTFKDNVEYDFYINLAACRLLKKENIVQFFKVLKDLTNFKTQTLVLPLSQKLYYTDEELEIATNKNWTITFAA